MILVNKDNIEKYKSFLQSHPKGHFLQSPEWAEVKKDWTNEIILVEDKNGNIKGSLSILIRKVPFFNKTIMYSPRGPVCDIHDKETIKKLTDDAKELAKKHKAMVLRIDPDIKSSDSEFRNIIQELGFKVKDNAKSFSDGIQPRYVFRLDVKNKSEEELLKSFHEKTRYNIRLATRKGVIVKEGKREDLKDFHDIMMETGSRDNFTIRSLEYFQKMYDVLQPKGYMKLLMAYYEDKPIAGVIPIMYGNKVWYLYGASSNKYRNVMPNYLLQWEMIKMSLERNCDIYDFRGVEGILDESHPGYGIYKFKKGFKGEFTEFIGEVYMVFNPVVNFIFEKSLKFMRTIRHLKMKIK